MLNRGYTYYRSLQNFSVATVINELFNSNTHKDWIVSHLDYDHYSLTGHYIVQNNVYIDRCYLPAVYAIPECREALAYLLAFQKAILEVCSFPLRSGLETMIEAIGKRCRRKIGIGQGVRISLLDLNNSEYFFIWPPMNILKGIPNICYELMERIKRLWRSVCKKQNKIKDTQCKRMLEEFKEEILEKIEMAFGDIIITEGYEIETQPSDAYERITSPRQEPEPFMTTTSERLLYVLTKSKDHVIEYHKIIRSYSNIVSLAYVLITNSPLKITAVLAGRTTRPEFFYFEKGENKAISVYLGDLEDTALDQALIYMLKNIPQARNPIILVAPHHGRSWSPELTKVKAHLVYMSRTTPRLRSERYSIYRYRKISNSVIVSGYTKWLTLYVLK